MLLCTIKYVALIIVPVVILLTVGALIRSEWVYRQRINIIDNKFHTYREYLDYMQMMRVWWIWDVEKLKKSQFVNSKLFKNI